MSTLTITPTPFQTVFDDAGAIVSGALVYTYLAGTSTPATTYADVNGATPNANPIVADSAGRYTAFLAPGTSYKFLYETAAGATLRTADNLGGVPANSAGVDVVGTAGEALTAGQAVYLSDGSGSKTAGDWYKADNTNAYSSTTNLVGVVTADIASGATGTVRLQGSVTGFSSLSTGATYYVGTGGSVVTTQPAVNTRRIGWADTTSSVVVQPEATSPVSSQTIDGTLSVTGVLSPLALLDISGASAGQVKFPATQNASSDKNTLDDYQEAQAWTPSFTGLTTSGAATITGSYWKIGSMVFWVIHIVPGTSTSSTAGSTYCSVPIGTPVGLWTCSAADDGAVSHGVGLIGTSGVIYTPTWSSITVAVEISGCYAV